MFTLNIFTLNIVGPFFSVSSDGKMWSVATVATAAQVELLKVFGAAP